MSDWKEIEFNQKCDHSFFSSKQTKQTKQTKKADSVKFCSKCGIMKFLNVIYFLTLRWKQKDPII